MAALMFRLGSRWSRMVSCPPRSLYRRGKKHPRSQSGRLNGFHSQFGLTILCLCRESNNDISDVQPTAQSVYGLYCAGSRQITTPYIHTCFAHKFRTICGLLILVYNLLALMFGGSDDMHGACSACQLSLFGTCR